MMTKQALAALLLLFSSLLCAQFTQVNPDIPVFSYGFIAPGDYDNDGDLDLFVTGNNNTLGRAMLYRNEGNWQFTPTAFIFPEFSRGSASWGDFDKDGWLDLAVSGAINPAVYASIFKLYRNLQGEGFQEIRTTLPQIQRSHHIWADHRNDGNLDLVFQGMLWNVEYLYAQTGIYRNLGDLEFELIQPDLTPIYYGEISMADFNNDGYLDLANSGFYEYSDGNYYPTTRVYKFTSGGTFQAASSPDLCGGSGIDWIDYDSDGDLDLIFCGHDGNGQTSTRILRNYGSSGFGVQTSTLQAVNFGDIACADYDNDGDSDVLVCGSDSNAHSVAKLYRNDGSGVFEETTDIFTTVKDSHACWADLDSDGDPDLIYLGEESQPPVYGDRIRFYRNDTEASNYPPAYPDLSYTPETGIVILPTVDDHTPNQCLSFDLRIGTSPGGTEILRPMANLQTGFRKIPGPGRPSFAQYLLAPGTYYLSAQAIDSSWRSSSWSPELMIQVGVENADPMETAAPLLLQASPNPFRNQVNIGFQVEKQGPARLELYNLRGQKLAVLQEESLTRGVHHLDWNPDPSLKPGIYLLKLNSNGKCSTLRLALIK